MRIVWLLAAAAALSACASAPVISLRGSPTDWTAWAGKWDGTYAGTETRRSGTLWFKLVAWSRRESSRTVQCVRIAQLAVWWLG
jgi:hypothetical protein